MSTPDEIADRLEAASEHANEYGGGRNELWVAAASMLRDLAADNLRLREEVEGMRRWLWPTDAFIAPYHVMQDPPA